MNVKVLVLAIILVVFSTTCSAALQDSLLAHYKLNDNLATTNVIDSKGYSNGTAQQNTSVLHTTGKVNGAFTFNGLTDNINTLNTFETVFNDDFTVNFWINTSDYTAVQGIFGAHDDPQLTGLFIETFNTDGSIYFSYKSNGVIAADSTANGVLTSDAWIMLTMTVAQVSPTQFIMKGYANGAEVANSGNKTGNMNLFLNDYPPWFGGENDMGASFYNVVGKMDNFMIFNKALSTDEIAELYNGGAGTEFEPVLETSSLSPVVKALVSIGLALFPLLLAIACIKANGITIKNLSFFLIISIVCIVFLVMIQVF